MERSTAAQWGMCCDREQYVDMGYSHPDKASVPVLSCPSCPFSASLLGGSLFLEHAGESWHFVHSSSKDQIPASDKGITDNICFEMFICWVVKVRQGSRISGIF